MTPPADAELQREPTVVTPSEPPTAVTPPASEIPLASEIPPAPPAPPAPPVAPVSAPGPDGAEADAPTAVAVTASGYPNPHGLPDRAVERPEVAAGAAFAGGLLLAMILKRLGR